MTTASDPAEALRALGFRAIGDLVAVVPAFGELIRADGDHHDAVASHHDEHSGEPAAANSSTAPHAVSRLSRFRSGTSRH